MYNPLERKLKSETVCDWKGNLYTCIPIRMHVHFNPITITAPKGFAYGGSIYAPYKFLVTHPTTVPAVSYNFVRGFYVDTDKCELDDVDVYLYGHYEEYIKDDGWQSPLEHFIDTYIKDINQKYNVNLDRNSIDMSIHFTY